MGRAGTGGFECIFHGRSLVESAFGVGLLRWVLPPTAEPHRPKASTVVVFDSVAGGRNLATLLMLKEVYRMNRDSATGAVRANQTAIVIAFGLALTYPNPGSGSVCVSGSLNGVTNGQSDKRKQQTAE